jgi:hypothetical protein
MPKSITIQKNPTVPESSNYQLLRQKGLEYIQQLGSKLWTDYNIHDPGITMLEALSYAITDLGYRTSLDIKDLLALISPETADADIQYPADKRQAFFTARNILTVNPWTTDDFRKLLINIDGIKNGWLFCRDCPCEAFYLYANCKKSILQYDSNEHKVAIKGLYDVLLEFEDEGKSGNLNSGKIKYNFSYPNGLQYARATIEMRLPSWAKLEEDKAKYKSFRNPDSVISAITVPFIISGNKADATDIPASPETVLDNALRGPVFATLEVIFQPDKNDPATETITFDDVPLTVWFRNTEERRALELDDLKTVIIDTTASGIFPKYLEKIKTADLIIAEAKKELHSHRNLAEDYCTIGAIEVADIGVCFDMEVEAQADIEAILGEAYYLIDQYFSPDLRFYSLRQLMDEKVPVDEIFEGPALRNGFIKNDELEKATLPTVLYCSDIINLLMDLPGVISIKNFALTRYDEDGFLVESQPWSMDVPHNHQPRLYIEASKALVFKNGLPFLADSNELTDTMQVIKGKHSQPKFSVLENDLPVPHGTYYDLQAYFPVQHSLPFTYGVGYDGLPESAGDLRKAQAKQLKAYLLFFEQLLVNYLSQLSHVQDLFAVDETVNHTYFSRFIDTAEIAGLADLYDGLDPVVLQDMTENNDTFLDRRNRFLDHLLARFSETFNDYALMLYSYTDDMDIAEQQLIDNKISFIRNFPEISSNRARSFNYKDAGLVCSNENLAGLTKRIQLLLGYGTPYTGNVELYEEKDTDGKSYERRWRLVGADKKIYLSSSTRYVDPSLEVAEAKAWQEIDNVFDYITDPLRYQISKKKKFVLNLLDETGEVIATRKQHFNSHTDAEIARDEIIAFAKQLKTAEQIFIVEHVLLRPRNNKTVEFPQGDPLLPVCLTEDCCDCCGEEDPYSFRITVVLNGEDGLANKGMEFRHFAEQTIRQETPAHLGVKVCWVSKEQLYDFQLVYCTWLAELARPEPDPDALHNKLFDLIAVFQKLKNVYPQAALFDCIDGNDENRVILGNTAIISDKELDEQIAKKKLK